MQLSRRWLRVGSQPLAYKDVDADVGLRGSPSAGRLQQVVKRTGWQIALAEPLVKDTELVLKLSWSCSWSDAYIPKLWSPVSQSLCSPSRMSSVGACTPTRAGRRGGLLAVALIWGTGVVCVARVNEAGRK